jgi:hypothetical protein
MTACKPSGRAEGKGSLAPLMTTVDEALQLHPSWIGRSLPMFTKAQYMVARPDYHMPSRIVELCKDNEARNEQGAAEVRYYGGLGRFLSLAGTSRCLGLPSL